MIKRRTLKLASSLGLMLLLLFTLSAEAYWVKIGGKRVRIHTRNGDPIQKLYLWSTDYAIDNVGAVQVDTNVIGDYWSYSFLPAGPSGHNDKNLPYGGIYFELLTGVGIGPGDYGDFFFDLDLLSNTTDPSTTFRADEYDSGRDTNEGWLEDIVVTVPVAPTALLVAGGLAAFGVARRRNRAEGAS